ncbi:parkin coregulated gene protein isoform X1 [Oryzias melastigma]|uniref:parkin coregulated gene protein isoform X1 n=1 Tax=Oryzias melastigma TaxID=30732 RepID=UPI000CF7FD10|nr:parkin coregulated gene protein isoform X1 [Oryzias melastigma]
MLKRKTTTELKAEAFTVRAGMKNAVVEPPPRTGVCEGQRYKPTAFRKYYERRDLPVVMDYGGRPNSIKWKVDIERIDYHHYLPLFFEGLRETTHPYETLACQGVYDMLDHGGPKILPVIPLLVQPIREALNTRNHRVMCNMLKVLQRLVTSADGVGEALVPYYRNILPMFNIFKDKKSLDSESGDDVADLVKETLTVMEQHGGQNAFMHIKYMIPTYQSCTRN